MPTSLNFDKIFKLVTSSDWKNYKVGGDYLCEGKPLTPAELTAACLMSIVIYDKNTTNIKGSSPTIVDQIKKQAAIMFAQNPHLYTNVTSVVQEAQRKVA